jgi:RNAse (barnase) inhibitor barstar
MMTTYVLDGSRIDSLEDFYREIGEVVSGPGGYFGKNPDALADCLSGGFGTPEGPDEKFRFVWRNSQLSRERLGYEDTVSQLRSTLRDCHPSNRDFVALELRRAESGLGPTTFDWVVDIFSREDVLLILE